MKAMVGEIWKSERPYELEDVEILGETDIYGCNKVRYIPSGRVNSGFKVIDGRVKYTLIASFILENE